VILSDRTIREALASGRIVVDPLADDAIQPSSVDVRLGTSSGCSPTTATPTSTCAATSPT
jgi:deoxycytidine triphosphate deaminase